MPGTDGRDSIDIALLAAVPAEVESLRQMLGSPRSVTVLGQDCTIGTFGNLSLIVGTTGLGKVNGAITTAALLERFRIGTVWNTGCAGAFEEGPLSIGDVLIARTVLCGDEGVLTQDTILPVEAIGIPLVSVEGMDYYDALPLADSTVFHRVLELTPPGRYVLTETGLRASRWKGRQGPDGPGLATAERAFQVFPGVSLTVGMASGDPGIARNRFERYHAIAENMEASGIAQTCLRYGVPMLECRGMSNVAGDRDKSRWQLPLALEHCRGVLITWLTGLAGRPPSPPSTDASSPHEKRMTVEPLKLGFSPCPNDTYIFHALAEGRIDTAPCRFETTLADVEVLNQRARLGLFDVCKVSIQAVRALLDRYWLLRAGGAIGRGCGPLIVARTPLAPADLRHKVIAIPGWMTTAAFLLRLTGVHHGETREMVFDQIMPAVAEGQVDAGVIIHEGRFTYPAYGLKLVLDLGRWWEETTGLPLPLGGIVVRRDLGVDLARFIEEKIRASLLHARTHPDDAWPYITQHAQEMAPDVIRSHIDTFVNDHSLDVGRDGADAIRYLLQAASKLNGIPQPRNAIFWNEAL